MADDNFYGRTREQWDDLEALAGTFLLETARSKKTTTYGELAKALAKNADVPAFDLSSVSERAAIGQLLRRLGLRSYDEHRVLISALVQFINENDAGSGFYSLAEEVGALLPGLAKEDRYTFWAAEVGRVHDAYSKRRR